MTKEGGKAHAAYEVLLALGRELGEARLEVVALNHLAILTFHQQDTDPPRVRRLLEEARGVAEEGGAEPRAGRTSRTADAPSFHAGWGHGARRLVESGYQRHRDPMSQFPCV
jgi:hypothetical protein